jgi:hypothetical protein
MKRRMVQSDDRSVTCLIYWDQFYFDVYLRPLFPPMKLRIQTRMSSCVAGVAARNPVTSILLAVTAVSGTTK